MQITLSYLVRIMWALSGVVVFMTTMAPTFVYAKEVKVAVAANFTSAAKEIGARFEAASGHKVIFSFGSTGEIYAQITHGAPFDIFLSADQARPDRAGREGDALIDTRFTYATGQIVLFSATPGLVKGEQTLKRGVFTKLAIANPATAPYGRAAVEIMRALGIYSDLETKIVQGGDITQAYQFVATGNAEVGFVAQSQVVQTDDGSRWLVPKILHSVIAQDAVMLNQGASNDAAHAFMAFLKGPIARAVKKKFGYGAVDSP